MSDSINSVMQSKTSPSSSSSSSSSFSKTDSSSTLRARAETFSKSLKESSSPFPNKEEFLKSLYNLIENNYFLLCETEKDLNFDIVELTLLMRSMGFRLGSLEFCEPTKEENDMNEITVQFRCNKTGLLSKLSMKINECRCPLKTTGNSFWEIQGVEPSPFDNVKTEVYQDTSCSLLPEVTKNVMSFSKSVIMLALHVFRNESQLTKNFYEEKRSLSQTPEQKKTHVEKGSNGNIEDNENSPENTSDCAVVSEKSINENQQNSSTPKKDVKKISNPGLVAIKNLQDARILLDTVLDYLKRSTDCSALSPSPCTIDIMSTLQVPNASPSVETDNTPRIQSVSPRNLPCDLLPPTSSPSTSSVSNQYANGTEHQNDSLPQQIVEEPKIHPPVHKVKESEPLKVSNKEENIPNNVQKEYKTDPLKKCDTPTIKLGAGKKREDALFEKNKSKLMKASVITKKVILPQPLGSLNYKNLMSPGKIDKVYRAQKNEPPSSNLNSGLKLNKPQIYKQTATQVAGQSVKSVTPKPYLPSKKTNFDCKTVM